jgi:putative ABC transport system permease protein
MILFAIAIALPLSYLRARNWLANFEFKIELNLWYFVAAGVVAMVIGWLTVGSQTIRAAKMNPTQCLRNE